MAHSKSRYYTFQNRNNKGADQTVQMRSLVWAFVVRKPLKTGFLASRSISFRSEIFSVCQVGIFSYKSIFNANYSIFHIFCHLQIFLNFIFFKNVLNGLTPLCQTVRNPDQARCSIGPGFAKIISG